MKAKNLRFSARGIASLVVLAAVIVPAMAQSPNFPNFANAGTSIVTNVNASITGSVLELNTAITNQHGSAWFSTPQSVSKGFTTTFTFQITNASPGDGLAFVIQNSLAGTGAIGNLTHGEGIAYEDITNSLAVEFDTFQNGNQGDPNNDHVAVQSCGTAANTPNHGSTCKLGLNATPLAAGHTLFDGTVHTVRIDYNPPLLQVNLDGADLFTGPNAISIGNLATFLGLGGGGTAFVGFTGATGASVENNDILSWTFTSHSDQSQTQTITPGQTTVYDFGGYNYAITPDAGTNQNTDQLTIDAIYIDPGGAHALGDGTPVFNPTANFPGATCFIYDGTGGHCIEFHASCNAINGGNDCTNGFYNLSTLFNKLGTNNIQLSNNPGLLMAPGQACASVNPIFDPNFTRNIFTGFDPDPIVKGTGGPGYSCFVAVENVTYQPADLALLNVASSKVKTGGNLAYIMALVNLGPNTANAVNVTFPVPTNTTLLNASIAQVACTLSFSGITCTPPPHGTPCDTVSVPGSVVCNAGVLEPFTLKNLNGAVVVANVKVNAPAGAKITNTATAGAINPDPKLGNNTSTAVTSVTQ